MSATDTALTQQDRIDLMVSVLVPAIDRVWGQKK